MASLFSYETLLSYATLWWHGSLSNQVGRAKHAWRFRSAELRRRVRSDAWFGVKRATDMFDSHYPHSLEWRSLFLPILGFH